MPKSSKTPALTVAEIFSEDRYDLMLLSHISDLPIRAQFLNDWYQRCTMVSSALFSAKRWEDCDLPVEGRVEEILGAMMLEMLHYSDYLQDVRGKLLADLFETTPAEVEFYPPNGDKRALYKQFADVYNKWFWFGGIRGIKADRYKLIVKKKFEIDFNDWAIIDLMAYMHGLAEDKWNLQFHKMPEFRWAFNGKEFAWYPKHETILLGRDWYTIKQYESFQNRLDLKGI